MITKKKKEFTLITIIIIRIKASKDLLSSLLLVTVVIEEALVYPVRKVSLGHLVMLDPKEHEDTGYAT